MPASRARSSDLMRRPVRASALSSWPPTSTLWMPRGPRAGSSSALSEGKTGSFGEEAASDMAGIVKAGTRSLRLRGFFTMSNELFNVEFFPSIQAFDKNKCICPSQKQDAHDHQDLCLRRRPRNQAGQLRQALRARLRLHGQIGRAHV